jgi:D-arabinose 1-dehydrogenase-like Zn-dependent alcohol dehydrogenase
VLLRATAVGLCGTDAHAFGGRFPLPLPIVLGHETVGVVEAVGSEVSSLMVGDRVGVSWVQAGCGFCDGCRRGLLARCTEPRTWVENGGGLSELVVAEASGCTLLPAGLDEILAAPMFCAGHVAMSGYRRANPQAGDRVAVLGIGGLGHLAVQIAHAYGHEVIAASQSREKLVDARELGATSVALIGDDAGEALEKCGGADLVLATTNDARAVSQAVRGLRAGGRLVMLGLANEPLAIDPLELVQREASLIGAVQGSSAELLDVLDLAARGLVLPRVEQYPLVLVHRALERLVDGRTRYRAVISG